MQPEREQNRAEQSEEGTHTHKSPFAPCLVVNSGKIRARQWARPDQRGRQPPPGYSKATAQNYVGRYGLLAHADDAPMPPPPGTNPNGTRA